MNNLSTPPPEYDLRPSTRDRQRDELIAIVGHESHEGEPRRRFVPLAAAAAVLALTAGLAIGVPALRNQGSEPAVNGPSRGPAVEALNEADKARYGKDCAEKNQHQKPGLPPQVEPYQVVDAFRFPKARPTTHTATWVVVHTKLDGWSVCGIDSSGKILQGLTFGQDQTMYRALETYIVGAGPYDKSIARITINVGTRPPMEAVLRNGFYFAPVPYVRVRGPHSPSTAIPVVARGYDAAGKLVYTSPRTDGEFHGNRNACYVDPNGKLVAWMSDNPRPDPKTCKRSYIWNYLPR
ncbi:hypothetical protein [Kribbella catacumbae]|uniref:hypothetical protein n=1 Tax=Kribbella catacumbae TaxID=460086 RepID=UPI00035CC710|nr:hypothetical protein [Kribbella catacumbae]